MLAVGPARTALSVSSRPRSSPAAPSVPVPVPVPFHPSPPSLSTSEESAMTADPARPSPCPSPPDQGAVTAETAVLLPALVMLLAVLLAASAAGMALIRYEDAARASARAAARGEGTAVVRATALRVAGKEASVRLAGTPATTTITVTGPAPGVLGAWGGWELRAEASADTERAATAGGAGG